MWSGLQSMHLRQNIKSQKTFPSHTLSVGSPWPGPSRPSPCREAAAVFGLSKAPPSTSTHTQLWPPARGPCDYYYLDTTFPSESGSPAYSSVCKILLPGQLSSVWQTDSLEPTAGTIFPCAFHLKNSGWIVEGLHHRPSQSSQTSTKQQPREDPDSQPPRFIFTKALQFRAAAAPTSELGKKA